MFNNLFSRNFCSNFVMFFKIAYQIKYAILARAVLSSISSYRSYSVTQYKNVNFAHVGTQGNEEADRLAKLASEQLVVGPEPVLPVPNSMISGLISTAIAAKWKKTLRGLNRLSSNQDDMAYTRQAGILVNAVIAERRIFACNIVNDRT